MDGQKESLFKVGDVVHLKSGGPSATVARVDGFVVEVAWFNERDDQYHTFSFPGSVLVKIET